ncbi:MAG: MFS transporter [Desulfobacterota bacterium]|nr:MFS transporter [Thermodesulfobacteriota bacterium]
MTIRNKQVWAWALYDAGNSAFATVVMAGFVPLLLKTCWSSSSDVTVSTAQLGMANTVAGVFIALLAPLLGAIADCSTSRKKHLLLFTVLGAASTALLAVVPCGGWRTAIACYCAASVGFSGALIFYDSLLPAIASSQEAHRVSSYGFALGYAGGGLIFAACVAAAALADRGGYTTEQAVRASFLMVGIWWLAFSVPLMLYVDEPAYRTDVRSPRLIRSGLAELLATLKQIRTRRQVWLFLLAYWLYIDGVDTVIKMALDYGISLGLSSGALVGALLLTQCIAFPCALAFGALGSRWGPHKAVIGGLGAYIVIVLWGMVIRHEWEFFVLASMVGMVQGGVQALSRSIFANLIPKERSAEFFGLYNMVGKYAALFGPAVLGITARLTGNPRAGIASLLFFFIIGALLLSRVKLQPQGIPR